MTSSMEFRAKTVGKAIENACRELNISSENLVHDVISPGSKGLFGLIGSKPAKIRVRINDQAQRIHTEADQAAKPCTTRVDPEPSRENKGAKPGPATPRGENEPAAQLCQEAVKRLIAPMDPEATIESSARGGRIDINISGGDPALIIGKHGQTIDAVQYLVEKIVNRATKRRVRIQVDVAGYQAARQKNLRRLAVKQAEKARRTGRPCSLGQMNANDRRIVHLVLKDDRSIRTQSVGDGPLRKLLIIPRRQRPQGHRPPAHP